MSINRRLAVVGAVAAVALAGTGSALAATPQKIYLDLGDNRQLDGQYTRSELVRAAREVISQRIYQDLADNGRLNGTYTLAEIERALTLNQVLRTDRPPAAVRKPIAVPAASEAAPAPKISKRSEPRIPFSALDAALLLAGGAPLLLIGAALRRRLAASPSDAPVVSG